MPRAPDIMPVTDLRQEAAAGLKRVRKTAFISAHGQVSDVPV